MIVLFAKKALGYLPDTVKHKTRDHTLQFMQNFVDQGSSVTIVTNRAGWLSEAPGVIATIARRAQGGTRFEVITPQPVDENVRTRLLDAGVRLYVTAEEHPPEARFTLVNADRSGSEKLAIAKGVHPEHEILVFDSTSGPQIIGMTKDIIRKSKAMANG